MLGVPHAIDALDATQANTSVNRTIMLHYSAQTLLVAGEVEEAAARTREGVGLVAHGGVSGRLMRFRGLREQMPEDVPGVRELDAALAVA